MEPTLGMMLVCAVAGAAAWSLTLWWLRDPRPAPVAVPRHPMDHDPHTVTVLGPSGRPNPMQYERLPNYAAARQRERELARQGKSCVIVHADSGMVRLDLSAWLGPYGRIGL